MLDPKELAWAGGLFDGEGSFGYTKDSGGRKTNGGRLSLAMTDRDSVERFMRAVGVGRIRKDHITRSGKQMYEWRVSNQHDIYHALHVLMPWLNTRRQDQARRLTWAGRNVRGCRPECQAITGDRIPAT